MQNVRIVEESSPSDDVDTYGEWLLKTIDDIRPNELGSTSHNRYVKQIKEAISTSLKCDSTHFLLFIKAIKDCKGPSYKRNVLLDILSKIIFTDEQLVISILSANFRPDCKNAPWKEMANSIATLPDIVANCDSLKKMPKFKADEFYAFILSKVLESLKILSDSSGLRYEQKLFFIQLIGRIAFSGHSQLVWGNFSSKAIYFEQDQFKQFIEDIFTIPIQIDSPMSTQFEMFIEPLYLPIFYNLKPAGNSGKLIASILGDKLLTHDLFKYLISNKAILQTNFNQDLYHQKVILFNIFAYLSNLSNQNNDPECVQSENKKPSMGGEKKRPTLLVEVLLEVAQSWSNSTKILLRPHDHNRFITCALVVAFRYALNHNKQCLAEYAEEIQSKIIQGIPVYLNRASNDERNLAMCLGEILLPKLHELIDSCLVKDGTQKKREITDLKFDVKWNEECQELKALFNSKLEVIFNATTTTPTTDGTNLKVSNIELVPSTSNSEDKPIECEEDDCDDNSDNSGDFGDESAPIYLRDCINGLVEDNKPRYVRLCLVKANDLICQLTEQEAINEKALKLYGQDKYVNDSIRDIAIEFAQVLLYLENQFNIDGFDSYRMTALTSLCLSAPDLVAKYLLDEFNGTTRNIRHQLDILQVLVASAKQLSEQKGTGNRFVKYAPLYFYGLAHQLETNRRILPTTIISVAKALETERRTDSDDSYLLSRILFSISLLIKCLNQQPITCKLSKDLIDILAAYRCHPDSGVRKAIAACLTVIRDSTPSVYFEENLHVKTTSLFGPWLANEFELIKQLKLRDK